MPSAPGSEHYQRESGLTRAASDAARCFAPLPGLFTFTVDIEEHGAHADLVAQTARLLDLLAAGGAQGTFFVLDAVAARDPGLVRRIAAAGHEIASHGHAHRPLHQEGPEAFGRGMAGARDRLADITGAAPAGYRAPFFSLTPGAGWATDILAGLGFAYSSSVLPARNPLAGWPGAPRQAFLWPSGLLELPVPVARFGLLRLPFLGGLYLRWLPPWLLRQCARRWATEEADGALWSYCHPYDLDGADGPVHRPDAGAFGSIMLWLNRGPTLPRLTGLIHGRRSESFAARLPALRAAAQPWRP